MLAHRSRSLALSSVSLAALSLLVACGPGEVREFGGNEDAAPSAGGSSGGSPVLESSSGGATDVGGSPTTLPGTGGTTLVEPRPSVDVSSLILINPVQSHFEGQFGFAFGTRNSRGVNGPAYTFDDGASTISANIPEPTRVCVSGTAKAVDLDCGTGDCWGKYWGAGWGLNVNQERNPGPDGANEPQALDLRGEKYVDFDVTGPSIPPWLRMLARAVGDDVTYCQDIVVGRSAIFLSELRKNCWEGNPDSEPIDTSKIYAIQFQIATMTYDIPFDFCIENLAIKEFVLR